MIRIVLAIGVLATCIEFGATTSAQVTWISSTAAQPWQSMTSPAWVGADGSRLPDVRVEPKRTHQTINGFGGCFNEAGWLALSVLTDKDRDSVIASLFGGDGCAFTLGRIPIGASDFALEWYSLDEPPGDLALDHFTIDRDRKMLLPFIKAAVHVQPDLNCWGSAWSPPSWMKDNNSYSNGSIRWEPEVLRSYARYLAKWVDAYRSGGVKIYAVTTQNEPNIASKYPTCIWTGDQLRSFIADYLGPTLKEQKPPVELWLGLNGDPPNGGNRADSRLINVLDDPKANPFIAGVAFQYDSRTQIRIAHERFPDKKLMQSETECFRGDNSWADAQALFGNMKRYFDNGANSYFMWNMVLDESGMSTWGWRQNAMVTIDRGKKTAQLNGEYYVMRHFSQYVKPGAKHITGEGAWRDQIAFANPDGSLVIVVGNSDRRALPIRLCLSGRANGDTFIATLPSASINTFFIPPADR